MDQLVRVITKDAPVKAVAISATALVERAYDDQEDFFHLNESFIEEYKERFLPTLALAAAPIALEVPAGVLSDVIAYMDETGILAFMGIE